MYNLVVAQPEVTLNPAGVTEWKRVMVETVHAHSSVLWNLRLSELLEKFSTNLKDSLNELRTSSVDSEVNCLVRI